MKKLLIASLLTLSTVFPASAGSLGLTQSNGRAGCSNNSLGLTQSNVCSREVNITNKSGITIYYDLGSNEDNRLGNKRSTSWTINGTRDINRGYVIVAFDSNIREPGIQLKRIKVYLGESVAFKLRGNTVVLYMN